MNTNKQVFAATTNGDSYITNSEILSNNLITEITDNKLYMDTKYSLLYEFKIPDNEHHQRDIINFSIPKQFEVLSASPKKLYSPDGEEVSTIQVNGNQKDGYYGSVNGTDLG